YPRQPRSEIAVHRTFDHDAASFEDARDLRWNLSWRNDAVPKVKWIEPRCQLGESLLNLLWGHRLHRSHIVRYFSARHKIQKQALLSARATLRTTAIGGSLARWSLIWELGEASSIAAADRRTVAGRGAA